MEVKLAALANAATDTAAGTVQPAISPEMSVNDVRGLARKRAEPAEAPSWSGSSPSPGSPGSRSSIRRVRAASSLTSRRWCSSAADRDGG